MRRILFLILIFLGMSAIYLTAQEMPRKQFKMELSSTVLNVNPGESKDVTINLLRSKRYAKAVAKLNVASSLPEGITVSFTPPEGMMEKSLAIISVSKDVKPGTYMIVPNVIIKDKRKGVALKVLVNEGPVIPVTMLK